MRYMIGSTSRPLYEGLKLTDLGMILAPGRAWRTPFCAYGCDNGVYAAFVRGRAWDQRMHDAWLRMLAKIPADDPPLWVLLPDAVADWPRTVELARIYLPVVRAKGWPVALALQDGCDFEEALELAPDWVFVAGSTAWKEQMVGAVCGFFQPRGIRVHVGRVNSKRRLRLCLNGGADSADGTTLNKFPSVTLPRVRAVLEGCYAA